MNLLGHAFYDPTGGAAVSKATTALLAMTALDTTNLRVAFTAPLSGKVKVVMSGGALHGAATYPFILLGVLQSTTVIARVVPNVTVCGAASATTPASLYAEFVVAVTPGAALTWDMAYGVEALVAATGLKYGGPNNNTTAGDAFGGISFSVWDASPVYLPAAMPTGSVHAKLDTIDDFVDTEVAALTTAVANVQADTDNIQTRLPAALVGGRMDASVGAMAADTITAAAIAADAGTELGTAVWATTVRALTDKAGFSLTTAPLDAAGTRAAVGLASANLDTQLSGINAKTTNLPSDPADASDIAAAFGTVNTTLGTIAGYIDTEVGAVKAVTDKLDTALELDGAVYRFTANALELAPVGGGSSGLDAAGVRAAVGLASANLDTQIATLATAANLATVATDTGTDIPAQIAALNNLSAAQVNAEVDTAIADAALATAANLATVDTVVDAIQLKTDQLSFTVAGQVNANLKSVAGTAVSGAGTEADPWGP